MIKTAIEYLNKKLSVIPVGQDKRPLINWKKYQTVLPTEAEVRAWWEQWPEANIGIVTGRLSNIAVVDVEKGGSTAGLPPTLIAKTGGGGWHYYYRYVEGIENKTRFRELTDIRGEGGFVVAPPSVHKSGKKYEWSWVQDINEFPKDIIPIHEKTDWKQYINGVSNGNRNSTAAKLCGKLMHAFNPQEWELAVWSMLRNWNLSNTPPMGEAELRAVFESIAKKAVNDERPEKTIEEKASEIYSITKSQAISRAYDEIMATDPNDVLTFGYEWIDEKLVGIFPGNIIAIGGESGTGKTTFANDILYANSKKKKCALFSLEERAEDYEKKAMYFEIGKLRWAEEKLNYPWRAYITGQLNKDEEFLEYFARAYQNMKNDNITYEQVGEKKVTIELVEERIKILAEQGVKLILIDHIHYFDLLRGKDTKADYIEQVMVSLHLLIKKLGVAVVLIAHYRKLDGMKPALDSFKDSISISQIASSVINLWRDRSNDVSDDERLTTYFYIPKTRQLGGEGFLKAKFDMVTGKYEQLTTEEKTTF